MKKVAAATIPNINLVGTVYGDDTRRQELPRGAGPDPDAIPNLKVDHRADHGRHRRRRAGRSTDQKLVGKVNVTGLGLPSEMAGTSSRAPRKPSRSGTRSTSATPPTTIAYDLATGKAEGRAPAASSRWAGSARSSSTTTCRGAMAPTVRLRRRRTSTSSRRSSESGSSAEAAAAASHLAPPDRAPCTPFAGQSPMQAHRRAALTAATPARPRASSASPSAFPA